jgi:hypothetical protein
MNIITIKKASDIKKIVTVPFYITGNKAHLQKEIDCNMWCLSFTSNSIEKITIQELSQSIDSLILNKKKQLHSNNPFFPALFYLWFDKQALQLRFNCISNIDNKLPFGCTLMLLDSPIDIFKDFLATTCDFFQNGDTIEFFNNTHEEKEDENKCVLSVFAQEIN